MGKYVYMTEVFRCIYVITNSLNRWKQKNSFKCYNLQVTYMFLHENIFQRDRARDLKDSHVFPIIPSEKEAFLKEWF